MIIPKIDQAVDNILSHIDDDNMVALARKLESSYGPTGNGHIQSSSLVGYARQYVHAYIYDQLAGVYGVE